MGVVYTLVEWCLGQGEGTLEVADIQVGEQWVCRV